MLIEPNKLFGRDIVITKQGYFIGEDNCTNCFHALELGRLIRHSSMVKNFPIVINGELINNPHEAWIIIFCQLDRKKHSKLFKCGKYEEWQKTIYNPTRR